MVLIQPYGAYTIILNVVAALLYNIHKVPVQILRKQITCMRSVISDVPYQCSTTTQRRQEL